jgi:hypothetical protein
MLSEAAQKLYAANLARTLILAEEAVKNGDEPFPAPEHSDFIAARKDVRTASGKSLT